ncbi:MAG TPA: alkaline phosphatase family protein, partial [Vicinamibacterales bacterium]|nr:alkaline phosphatase family protein [Vicinamibacterales bacterium]
MTRHLPWSLCVAVLSAAALVPIAGQAPAPRRNVIVFVADGLRHGSVNAKDTPALWTVRTKGVHFENSHSVFPTFTLANASAIATGHFLGDTGVFSNTIRPGFAMFDTGNFNLITGTPVPFMENDEVLADIDDHFGGSFLGSDTFLSTARAHGYRTAAIGKLGPAAMQDVAAIEPQNRMFPANLPGIIVDDETGTRGGLPLPQDLAYQMTLAGAAPAAPARTNGYEPSSPYSNGFSGGTLAPNTVQQDWFIDMATRWVLPSLTKDASAPFAMVFWSRDPDGTQHNNGDSLGTLYPGINGPTSIAGVRNADRALQRLLDWLDAHPDIKANTDVFVTSDHGFATVSRREIDRTGRATASQAARHEYVDAAGEVDTHPGTLPTGFL